ncbi:hypothetical protein [Haloarcula pelagica]|uniref:hypothetical protein n=1 Tax=Haloarcula pelagica TaxID=3033389 RepID=UPI0024C47261|nr:hypothetical protein [Halomicroarcula sp. YJ-61-S]
MRQRTMLAWAFLVSLWTAIVSGAAVYEPAVDLVPVYAVSFQLVAFGAAYWTIRRNEATVEEAHRPGRMLMFILALFVATVPLVTIANALLGHTSPLAIVAQLLGFLIGLAVGLYVAYGGGFDYAWEHYT